MLPLLFIILRIVIFIIGLIIVCGTFISALRTFVLPRQAPDSLNRTVLIAVRKVFALRIRSTSTYEQKDKVMELYGPAALIATLITWLICIQIGYILLLWSVNQKDWFTDFDTSGSSLLTLGFSYIDNFPSTILIFSEATIGLVLVALLISYLPTIYTAFSRREAAVTALETRAGSPPAPINMIRRYTALNRLGSLGEIWSSWEVWFIDIEESHTSLAILPFYRSPQSHRSWVGAAGAVLDAASLTLACLDIPHDSQADLCIRSGYLALRSIATLFSIDFDPNPAPTDPISVTRAEFNAVWDEMQQAGAPLKKDQDQAWRDFAGWRVNYDRVLVALAEFIIIPETRWISDRAVPNAPVTLRRWRGRQQRLPRHEWFNPANIPHVPSK